MRRGEGITGMAKHKDLSTSRLAQFVLLGLTLVGVLLALLLLGKDVSLLNPKGHIAQKQANLLVFSTSVMLVIAIPTLITLYLFAWKYRAGNHKPRQGTKKGSTKGLFVLLWMIPIITVGFLTTVVWPATHQLDPHTPITADAKPLEIQVIALRWKWLFIYPEQGIATVNFVQIPTDTPLKFDLTADETPMSSFWIPHLGGQLYAMTGHDNQLNLIAQEPGDYAGQSAEINGDGFAGMTFTARASGPNQFEDWVNSVKASGQNLDEAAYEKLLEPSNNNLAAFYASTKNDLYYSVLAKYMGMHSHMEAE